MAPALVGVALGAGSVCGGCASVALTLSFLPSVRGRLCCGFCGLSRRLLGVYGIFVGLARRRLYGRFTSFSWRGVLLVVVSSFASGVGADPWRLVVLSGRALAVDRLGGWAWFLGFCGAL